ncbi:MAG: extracellular solute-binding protein [Eubacteriales bacterium]|nr:extracellular solute-binding protein [Eubacteriales bacterium]
MELTFWTQDSSQYEAWFVAAIDAYNEQSNTVSISAEYFPNYSDKLSQAYAADQEPDVAFTWQGITNWAKAGKISAVPAELAASMEENIYPGALTNKMYNGQYYGIPAEINVESPTLFVNMDLLSSLGETLQEGWVENNGPASWDELAAFAAKLTEKDELGVKRSGLSFVYGTWEATFVSLIWQLGGDYRDEANSCVHFNTDEGKAAYCQGDEAISDAGSTRWDLFTQGNAVMSIGAPWNAASLLTDAPEMNYQVFNMPAFIEGSDPYCVATGGWGYIVSAKLDDAKAAAAWDFVSFLTSSEMSGSWALATGALSADKNANTGLTFDANVGSVEKAIAISTQILPYGQEDGAYTLDASQLLYTIVRQHLRQLLEEGDIEAALSGMEYEGNEMIETNLSR